MEKIDVALEIVKLGYENVAEGLYHTAVKVVEDWLKSEG